MSDKSPGDRPHRPLSTGSTFVWVISESHLVGLGSDGQGSDRRSLGLLGGIAGPRPVPLAGLHPAHLPGRGGEHEGRAIGLEAWGVPDGGASVSGLKDPPSGQKTVPSPFSVQGGGGSCPFAGFRASEPFVAAGAVVGGAADRGGAGAVQAQPIRLGPCPSKAREGGSDSVRSESRQEGVAAVGIVFERTTDRFDGALGLSFVLEAGDKAITNAGVSVGAVMDVLGGKFDLDWSPGDSGGAGGGAREERQAGGGWAHSAALSARRRSKAWPCQPSCMAWGRS